MNYDDIDFNALYINQKKASSFKIKSQESWDKKASSMNQKVHSSIYNDEFLERIDTQKCNSLLDVGCGVGNLSLKLAKKLDTVYALDYSKEMLNTLHKNAQEQKLNNIHLLNVSWYDSWEKVPHADIVIASRSMEVVDMKEALQKLHDKAKKRVYISYKVGGSFLSDEILHAMQKEVIKKPDYIYVVNVLYQMGIHAKVDFVQSEGRSTIYNSLEEFIQSVSWSIGELSHEEIQRLSHFYTDKIQYEKKGIDYVTWAVISWQK